MAVLESHTAASIRDGCAANARSKAGASDVVNQ
jgi:hypothetical protein